MVNMLGMPSEDVGIALGHEDGGELVRRLYGHRDKDQALDRVVAAIGSRAMDRTLIKVHQSRLREIAGIIFNSFVKLFTGLPFQDTQCGFRAFVRERSTIIFEQQRVERFGFDPEILFLAKRHGLRVVEVPVRWAHDEATRVNVVRDSVQMFGDLLFIRWNWLLGRYPKQSRA